MTKERMIEETSFAVEELYQEWQDDPSQMLMEDVVDRTLFNMKDLAKEAVAHERRFDMGDERMDGLEGRIASLTTEIARWREEIRLMRERKS